MLLHYASDADLAVIAYNTLLMCNGRKEVANTFRRAAQALCAGGRLIISIIRMSNGLERVIYHHGRKETDGAMFVMRSSFRRMGCGGPIVRSYYVDELRRDGEVRSFFTEWEAVEITPAGITSIGEEEGFRLVQAYKGYDGVVLELNEEEPPRYLLEFHRKV